MERLRDFWVRAALALSLALPFYFFAAALGARLELFDWRFASETMVRAWGRTYIYAALAIGLIGLALALITSPARGRRIALFASFVPAVALAYALYSDRQAAAAAPIHDLTTDTLDPPQYTDTVKRARARIGHSNGLDLAMEKTPDGRAATDVQHQAYPDILSIPTGLAPSQAFTMALAAAREQHWTISVADPGAGNIEATSETLWFGFVDDIAVRVRPDGAGARIDMRSSSRVRVSDDGSNAARMRAYLSVLRQRIEEAESH